MIKKNLASITPVSYTHLDVYKRQELNDKLEKEVVAFLNNKEGGILYIGVDDNGKPVELPDIDSIQLKICLLYTSLYRNIKL